MPIDVAVGDVCMSGGVGRCSRSSVAVGDGHGMGRGVGARGLPAGDCAETAGAGLVVSGGEDSLRADG